MDGDTPPGLQQISWCVVLVAGSHIMTATRSGDRDACVPGEIAVRGSVLDGPWR